MAQLFGKILSVDTRSLSEPLMVDAAADDLVLYVLDASSFDEAGGTALVSGTPVVYTGTAGIDVDETLDQLTLAAPLPVSYSQGTEVEVYPAVVEKVATVDLGGEGDAVPATVPHALVELIPDGFRDSATSQESVICEFRGEELVVTDLIGSPLAKGSIDPDRLAVGVVGELVQGPSLTDPLKWSAADPWTLLGPDSSYPDANFVRSANDGSYGVDVDYYLTDLVPVKTGQNVRVSALCRPSVAANTSTAGGVTRARVRVEFFKADQLTRLSGQDQLSGYLLDQDLVPDQWQEIIGNFPVPEGYVFVKAKLQSTYQDAGTIDYIKPSVTVPWSRVASADFVPGESGWGFDDTVSQVEDLNVIGALGVQDLSVATLAVGGSDFGDTVTALPLGILAYDIATSGQNTGTATAVGTEYVVAEFAMGPTMAGRLYRIVAEGHLVFGAVTDAADMSFRYTTNGTSPDLTSAPLRTERFTSGSSAPSTKFRMEKLFTTGTYDNLRFGLGMTLAVGTSVYLYGLNSARNLVVYVEDLGLYAQAATAGTLRQRSFAVASTPAEPDPVVNGHKSFPAIWTETYNGNGSKRLTQQGLRSSGMYQGTWGDGHGNQRSIAGYNYAAIQAALAGATITKVTLTYRVKYGAGGTKFNPNWGTHTLASAPTTLSSSSFTANRYRVTGQQEGSLPTVTLPTAIGNEFKAGTCKGILLGPQDRTSTVADPGGVNGYDNGNAPLLTFYYSK